MREYLKLIGIRITIYILVFIFIIILFDNSIFQCSKCYIKNSICLGGYGGLDMISVLLCYIIPLIMYELVYLIISKKTLIKATKLTIIMSIVIVIIYLGIFKFIESLGRFNNDVGCNYCATATNCNNDYTNCSFIDANSIKQENLNCSIYFK